MIQGQLVGRGITARAVLEAMERIPRHLFVAPELARRAYEDCALPSEQGQTISQPYIVAIMTESLDLKPEHRVLEIGTGTGYQTAILATLVREVYTIERMLPLAETAWGRLAALGIKNVHSAVGDGSRGWHWALEAMFPEAAARGPSSGATGKAPGRSGVSSELKNAFDRILVTAASPEEPQPLIEQLARGGILLLPQGPAEMQELVAVTRQADGSLQRRRLLQCRFVPLIGKHGWNNPPG
jgi:protein-L-isoaspartate(D-aspartate) O-methyltransferase